MIYVMLVHDSQSKKAPFRSSESKGKYWPKADLTCQAWAADYVGSANGVCVCDAVSRATYRNSNCISTAYTSKSKSHKAGAS